MNQEFRDLLARLAPGESPERLDAMAAELGSIKSLMMGVLSSLKETRAKDEVLGYFHAWILKDIIKREAEASRVHLTPELLEWARSEVNVQQILAAVAEVERTGGYQLKDFIHELELDAKPHD